MLLLSGWITASGWERLYSTHKTTTRALVCGVARKRMKNGEQREKGPPAANVLKPHFWGPGNRTPPEGQLGASHARRILQNRWGSAK